MPDSFDAHDFSGRAKGRSSASVVLTKSQHAVFDTLCDLGTLQFTRNLYQGAAELKPRFHPLVAGPTGSGKSFLVERVAHVLDAGYLRLTYGDFIPQGARNAECCTLVQVARRLAEVERWVIHIDEIDKWLVGDREWGRAISVDLWNLLDGKLPWDQLSPIEEIDEASRRPVRGKKSVSTPKLNYADLAGTCFFVGSGTWQAVFERRQARSIGFGPRSDDSQLDRDNIVDEIRRAKVIPTELSGRFSTDLLVLNYPNAEETERLLELYGLHALAREVGWSLSARDVDYAASGMRAFESLKTRLLLEHLRQSRQSYSKDWEPERS